MQRLAQDSCVFADLLLRLLLTVLFYLYLCSLHVLEFRVIFEVGSRGSSPSLDWTCPWTQLWAQPQTPCFPPSASNTTLLKLA